MAAARARGAVLGSLVADAAAVPVHWCYDPEKLAEHLKQAAGAELFLSGAVQHAVPAILQLFQPCAHARSCK